MTGMHSYEERPRRTSPVSSGQTVGVVSSSTGREDQSPIPQCSSSSYSCHTFGGKLNTVAAVKDRIIKKQFSK